MKSVKKNWILTAAVAVLVAACGGGGGSGGATGGPPVTGTTKTTFVTGAISGFGSVIVNGVRYESDSATVTLEGHPGTVGQLKVGEVIHLKAEIDAQGNSHAKAIDQERLAQGTVQAVDVAAGTLTIAGQVIHVDNETSFDDSIPGGSLAGIAVGERIEVHGFASASGEARATRLEKADAGDNEVELTGPVSLLDTVAKRFTIGSQVVDYSTATLERFPASGPVAGDIVEVKGTTMLADGALKAVKVQREEGGLDGHSGDGGELEGLVTRFVSATDFDVAGQQVTTTGSTSFVGGTAADLKLDVKVEVEGKLDASGALVAAKVVFKRASSIKLAASVEAVDATAGTLRALGVTFVVTADTRKEDKQTDDHFFDLSDLHVGDWVELSGYPDPAGSGKVIATRLERDDPENEVELRGPADQLAAPAFKIIGVSVETTPSTEFEDGEADISSADFFARAGGQIVDVEGTWNGASLLADKAEIEHEDNGSAGPPPVTPPSGSANRAPVARAGTARSVAIGATVALDGRASSDPDGNAITYAWTLQAPSGSAAALTGAGTSQPSFVADVAGTYTASLTVSDGSLTGTASVSITASAAPPALDGATLYTQKCQGCHGPIAPIFNRNARTASNIQTAINSNKGGMGSLSTLTAADVQAIADAIRAANP
jgi:mono/diheme cytochrome c family protein